MRTLVAVLALALLPGLVLSSSRIPDFHPAAIVYEPESGIGGTACYVDGGWWTAAHVAQGLNQRMTWKRGLEVPARVIFRDPKRDLARLEVSTPPMPWLESTDRELTTGDPITIYGWLPDQFEAVVTHGWVFFQDGADVWVDALVWPGMSGSCVVDATNGKFIGFATRITYPKEGFRSVVWVRRMDR